MLIATRAAMIAVENPTEEVKAVLEKIENACKKGLFHINVEGDFNTAKHLESLGYNVGRFRDDNLSIVWEIKMN